MKMLFLKHHNLKGKLKKAIEIKFLKMTLKDIFKSLSLDCVYTMPAHFENGEKCDG